jgi:hypothetical protein
MAEHQQLSLRGSAVTDIGRPEADGPVAGCGHDVQAVGEPGHGPDSVGGHADDVEPERARACLGVIEVKLLGQAPRPTSSPWILRYPQPGFSRASRPGQGPDIAPPNRMHMIIDHHGRTAGGTTTLLRAVDEILGTHRIPGRVSHGRQRLMNPASLPERCAVVSRGAHERMAERDLRAELGQAAHVDWLCGVRIDAQLPGHATQQSRGAGRLGRGDRKQ